MLLVAIVIILMALNSIYYGTYIPATADNKNDDYSMFQLMKFLFTNVICEVYCIMYFVYCLKSKEKWIEESTVQIVEVVLQPKVIKKAQGIIKKMK